jgi:hypothetical protein
MSPETEQTITSLRDQATACLAEAARLTDMAARYTQAADTIRGPQPVDELPTLSPAETAVLATLNGKARRIGSIATASGRRRPAAYFQVHRLMVRGLVQRVGRGLYARCH